MKIKKIQKLELNKITVAHLVDENMSKVLGGDNKERCAYSYVQQSCYYTDLVFTCPSIPCPSKDAVCIDD